MATRIRRWVETDTGHRVPNHKSKCKNLHGHRYRWEAELEGDVVSSTGVSDEGMLMDFSDISKILTEFIHDIVDHAFIVYDQDIEAIYTESIDEKRSYLLIDILNKQTRISLTNKTFKVLS